MVTGSRWGFRSALGRSTSLSLSRMWGGGCGVSIPNMVRCNFFASGEAELFADKRKDST